MSVRSRLAFTTDATSSVLLELRREDLVPSVMITPQGGRVLRRALAGLPRLALVQAVGPLEGFQLVVEVT